MLFMLVNNNQSKKWYNIAYRIHTHLQLEKPANVKELLDYDSLDAILAEDFFIVELLYNKVCQMEIIKVFHFFGILFESFEVLGSSLCINFSFEIFVKLDLTYHICKVDEAEVNLIMLFKVVIVDDNVWF